VCKDDFDFGHHRVHFDHHQWNNDHHWDNGGW
jgi:hypothetical protein